MTEIPGKQVSHRGAMPEMNRKIEWRDNGCRPARAAAHHRRMRAVRHGLLRKKSVCIGKGEVELCDHSAQFKASLPERLSDLNSNQARQILLLRLQAFPARSESRLPLRETQSLPSGKCAH